MATEEREAERRAERSHPWARQGSTASRSIGAQRWLVEHNALLLPTLSDIEDYCAKVISGELDAPVTPEDVRSFISSDVFNWIQWAHLVADISEDDRYTLDSASLDTEFGSNKFKPVDLIAMYRDAPHFSRFLFSGDDPYRLTEEMLDKENRSVEVERVGITFYDAITQDKEGMDLGELMVWEPTPILASFLSLADLEPHSSISLRALSNAGLPFNAYAEAMYLYRFSPDIANSCICEFFSEEMYVEDDMGERYVVPDTALDTDGFSRWIYNVYFARTREMEAFDHEDLDIGTLIKYASVGVFSANSIRECQRNGIEPDLAASLHGNN